MEGYNTEQQSQLVSTLSVTLKSKPPLLVSVTLILQTMAQPTKQISSRTVTAVNVCVHTYMYSVLYLKYNWNAVN